MAHDLSCSTLGSRFVSIVIALIRHTPTVVYRLHLWPQFMASLYLCPLQCDFADPFFKRWNLFPHSVNLDFPCVLVWPIELGRCNIVPVTSSVLEAFGTFTFLEPCLYQRNKSALTNEGKTRHPENSRSRAIGRCMQGSSKD